MVKFTAAIGKLMCWYLKNVLLDGKEKINVNVLCASGFVVSQQTQNDAVEMQYLIHYEDEAPKSSICVTFLHSIGIYTFPCCYRMKPTM